MTEIILIAQIPLSILVAGFVLVEWVSSRGLPSEKRAPLPKAIIVHE